MLHTEEKEDIIEHEDDNLLILSKKDEVDSEEPEPEEPEPEDPEESEESEEPDEDEIKCDKEEIFNSYNHLIDQVVKFNKEIHTMMTILRYQYDHYSWWNIATNILIISMSSIITFLESIRANVTFGVEITLLFNMVTITFGFLIALTLAIFKFLKIQDSMEEVRSGILTLELPYKDSCQFYLEICNKIFGDLYGVMNNNDVQVNKLDIEQREGLKKDIDEKSVETSKEEYNTFLEKWKQNRIKSIYPELQVQQLLTQMQLYDYWKKYLLQDLKNIKMINRRNFDIKLYESAQDKMTSLKMEMMCRMNKLVEGRHKNELNVEEIEKIWQGDMILLDRLEENYEKIMNKSQGDKVRCCSRDCYCHKTCNGLFTMLRDMFRACGCCCCKKEEINPEDLDMILKGRYTIDGQFVNNDTEEV